MAHTPEATGTNGLSGATTLPPGGTAARTVLRTPLCDWHAAHGGRLVDFAGWLMPVQYTSIVAEHHATRKAATLFDVSHMGRLRFIGVGAGAFLDRLVTRRVVDLPVGQIRYGLVTNDNGGILDDVLVYHLAGVLGGYHLMVVNASNREKILAWVAERLQGVPNVICKDVTNTLSMVAVQGPLAESLLQPLVNCSLAELAYYHGREATIDGAAGIVSRTGYTGEDGFEIMVPATDVERVWSKLLAAGQSQGVLPAGLGCRDTLRLEAAMPLYGHELSETINPLEAGLGFAVDLEGRTFPGREPLAKIKQIPQARKRVGLLLSGKRVPREHYPIVVGGATVGEVTSGTFSPTFERPLAMGYLAAEHAAPGTEVQVDIRGQLTPAEVVKLPFYRRQK